MLVGKHRVPGVVREVRGARFVLATGDGLAEFPSRTRVERVAPAATARTLLARLTSPPQLRAPLPTVKGTTFLARSTHFAATPLREQVELLRFLIYEPEFLDPPTTFVVHRERDGVWAHLAVSLGVPSRAVRQAVFRRDARVAPRRGPVAVGGHDYIGAFGVGRELLVADRCYAGETHKDLVLRVRTLEGIWHAWVRPDPERPDRNLALYAAHTHYARPSSKPWRYVGNVEVDAGHVALLDASRIDTNALFLARVRQHGIHWDDELVDASGCHASTHMGDGQFPIFARKVRGRAVAVRVDLAEVSEDE